MARGAGAFLLFGALADILFEAGILLAIAFARAEQGAGGGAAIREAAIAGNGEKGDGSLLILGHVDALGLFSAGIEAGFSVASITGGL